MSKQSDFFKNVIPHDKGLYLGIDRCRWCRDCGILFVYSSEIEGLSDDDFPFEPCPECGSDSVESPDVEPWGGVHVIDKEG